MAPTDAEMVKRIRAARAYADLSQKELGEAIELSAETIKRIEAGTRIPKDSEVAAIAEKTGLPRAFFLIEFGDLEFPGIVELAEANRHMREASSRDMLTPETRNQVAEGLGAVANSLQEAAATLLRFDLELASGQSEPSSGDTEEPDS